MNIISCWPILVIMIIAAPMKSDYLGFNSPPGETGNMSHSSQAVSFSLYCLTRRVHSTASEKEQDLGSCVFKSWRRQSSSWSGPPPLGWSRLTWDVLFSSRLVPWTLRASLIRMCRCGTLQGNNLWLNLTLSSFPKFNFSPGWLVRGSPGKPIGKSRFCFSKQTWNLCLKPQ